MARRQMNIPGTEAQTIPELDEAAEEWREARKASKAAKQKENEKKFAVIALMGSHKLEKYKYTEQESGEEILLSVDAEPKVRAKKTGEAEPEPIGDGIPTHDNPHPDDVAAGLIRQAEKSMDDANVAETTDGDVVPPEKAAPKAKRSKKKGK